MAREDRVLTNRGQLGMGQTGSLAVIIADNGHIIGHAPSAFMQHAHRPHRHQIR